MAKKYGTEKDEKVIEDEKGTIEINKEINEEPEPKSLHCRKEDCINFSIWSRLENGNICMGPQLNSRVYDNRGDFVTSFNKCVSCKHFIKVDNYQNFEEAID